jgi:zinc protease
VLPRLSRSAIPLSGVLLLGPIHSAAQTAAPAAIDIPYQRFVLPNGLTVIVHEDHKAPIVAVNVWYHVGSKNERPGRTGFAHLFEHLMFNGSENYDKDFFGPLEQAGATDMNGTTNEDPRTTSRTFPPVRWTSCSGWNRTGWTPHRGHQSAEARRAARRGPKRKASG